MSISRGPDKQDVVHIHSGISLGHKKRTKHIYKTERVTELENKLTVTKERTQRGRDGLGVWD